MDTTDKDSSKNDDGLADFGKSPDQDAIAPTGVPMLPDEELGQGYSPWVWGTALIIGMTVLIIFFGR
ncbi:MAG: hypothetical protein V4441_05875 [Pseudomonadota bacterium]